MAIIGFGDAFEYLQWFLRYGLCNLVPFSLDFVYLGLVFACQRLDFGPQLLEMLFLLIYLALYFFAFGFIGLNIFQQFQRLGFYLGIVGFGCVELSEDCGVFFICFCGVEGSS